jgi:hypothetical protein
MIMKQIPLRYLALVILMFVASVTTFVAAHHPLSSRKRTLLVRRAMRFMT